MGMRDVQRRRRRPFHLNVISSFCFSTAILGKILDHRKKLLNTGCKCVHV